MLVFGAALAVYVALGQRVLVGDASILLVLVQNLTGTHHNHLAYAPVLRLLVDVGSHFGLTTFEVARLFSQVGAAAGVAFSYLAARQLVASRRDALWVAALVGTAPSILFFATVVEVQGPYQLCIGAGWWCATWLSRDPTPSRGALLGAVCGVAFLGHATGAMLPAPLLLAAWHFGGRMPWWTLASCALVHGVIVFVLPWALRGAGVAGVTAGAGNAMAMLVRWPKDVVGSPSLVWGVLWHEVLVAFVPLSILWVRALGGQLRLAGIAVLAATPYLVLSLLLLGKIREFGAYQHAVVWLFAWILVQTSGWRVRVLAVAIALAFGIWRVRDHDQHQRVSDFAAGVRQVAGATTPLLLVAGDADLEACFIGMPGVEFETLHYMHYRDPVRGPLAEAALMARIAAHQAAGGRVFLTQAGVGLLGEPVLRRAPAYAAMFSHLYGDYRHVIVGAHGFRVVELLPKK